MRKKCRRYRWMPAVCLAAGVYALCLGGGRQEGEVRPVSSPEELRGVLREAQWGLLPLEAPALYDAGEVLFLPGGEDGDAFLLGLLLDVMEGGEDEGLDVIVSEDTLTRETLFHGPGGGLVWTLPPEGGYSPWWAFGLLFPGEDVSGFDHPGAFDPSLVHLRVALVPLAFPDIPDGWQGGALTSGSPKVLKPGDLPHIPLPPSDAQGGGAVVISPPPAAETNEVAGVTLLAAVPEGEAGVVYVDAARGSDAWTGRSNLSRGGGEGPKRTVEGGMAAVKSGGQLVIAEGRYAECLNVRGTGVRVTFTGDVTLGAAAAN